MLEKIDYIFKIIVVGSISAGKTSLVNGYLGMKQVEVEPTKGMNLISTLVKVKEKVVRLNIWDIGGDPKYSRLFPLNLKGALGGIIVVNLQNEDWENSVTQWLEEVEQCSSPIPFIIVGNKKGESKNKQPLESSVVISALKKRWEMPIELFYYDLGQSKDDTGKIFETLTKLIHKTST